MKIHAVKHKMKNCCSHCKAKLVKTFCGITVSQNHESVSNFMPDITCEKCRKIIDTARIKEYTKGKR